MDDDLVIEDGPSGFLGPIGDGEILFQSIETKGEAVRCIKEIYTDSYSQPVRQCKRLSVKGRYCQQHTPEAIKKRQKEKQELFENTRILQRQEWSGPSAVRLIKKVRQDLLDDNPKEAEAKLRIWLNDNEF